MFRHLRNHDSGNRRYNLGKIILLPPNFSGWCGYNFDYTVASVVFPSSTLRHCSSYVKHGGDVITTCIIFNLLIFKAFLKLVNQA